MCNIRYATKKALEVDHCKETRVRHYAMILSKRGRILSSGRNSYKDSSSLQRYYAAITGNYESLYNHAEISAISRLKSPEKAYKMIVVRVDSEGKQVLSKPCKICEKAIKDIGISVVEYSTGVYDDTI